LFQKAEIVLDDAALGLYQEMTGRPIALSEYFDRSYLRKLTENPGENSQAESIILKRHSNYANANLVGQFGRIAWLLGSDCVPRFARDYALRELKSNRAILLGNSR
jgi:hypothetical protein